MSQKESGKLVKGGGLEGKRAEVEKTEGGRGWV
jgi:hypothetical protein